MLRAVLLDFNGVLVDDEPLHADLLRRVLAEEGVERDAGFYRDALGLDDRTCFARALGTAAEPARIMRLVARKASYYRERIRRSGHAFFPGALELVGEIGAAGLRLGLVSGALRDEVADALEQAGIGNRFQVIVTAEDVAAGKPDPEGYRRALAELNARPPLPERLIHPHEVVALEDSPAGLAAAGGAGVVTLGVAHGADRARLAAADFVVEDLEGLGLERLRELTAEASRR